MKKIYWIIIAICLGIVLIIIFKDDKKMVCPFCNGTKEVIATTQMGYTKVLPCPICIHTGELTEDEYKECTTKLHPCVYCNGHGGYSGVFGDYVICTFCLGKGELTKWDEFSRLTGKNTTPPQASHSSSHQEGCISCSGTGRCHMCNGNGYTYEQFAGRFPCSSCDKRVPDSQLGWIGDGNCSRCHGTGYK